MNGKEWDRGRGTAPGPSGKGKEEKHTFFFYKIGYSLCSRLDPEFVFGRRNVFAWREQMIFVRSQRHKELALLSLFMNVYL